MSKAGIGNSLHPRIAYIVGDDYPLLSNLSRIITIRQFMIAVLEKTLPPQRLWIVGQGLSHDEVRFLRLCETHLEGARFYFGAQSQLISSEHCADSACKKHSISNQSAKNIEWRDFHFIDATRVQAELSMKQLSEFHFLEQDFLFIAAKELTVRACQSAVENAVLVIKQASFQSFHRLFPLSIKVETKFQIMQDNQNSLKSLTRFYQGHTCTAEVNLSFALYSKEQADVFYAELAEKTLGQCSKIIEEE